MVPRADATLSSGPPSSLLSVLSSALDRMEPVGVQNLDARRLGMGRGADQGRPASVVWAGGVDEC